MTDDANPKSGDAAWKQQRDEIARRNAEAHKRAESGRRSRANAVAAQSREQVEREAEQLRELNAQIAARDARGIR